MLPVGAEINTLHKEHIYCKQQWHRLIGYGVASRSSAINDCISNSAIEIKDAGTVGIQRIKNPGREVVENLRADFRDLKATGYRLREIAGNSRLCSRPAS